MGNHCGCREWNETNSLAEIRRPPCTFPSLAIASHRRTFIQEKVQDNFQYGMLKLTLERVKMKLNFWGGNIIPEKELMTIVQLITGERQRNRLDASGIDYLDSWMCSYLRDHGMHGHHINEIPRTDRRLCASTILSEVLCKTTKYINTTWKSRTNRLICNVNILIPDVCGIIDQYIAFPGTEYELLIEVLQHQIDIYQNDLKLKWENYCMKRIRVTDYLTRFTRQQPLYSGPYQAYKVFDFIQCSLFQWKALVQLPGARGLEYRELTFELSKTDNSMQDCEGRHIIFELPRQIVGDFIHFDGG